jgi:phosphoserine aminotransferase
MGERELMKRVYNFSAGPAVLPEPVIHQIREDLPVFKNAGASIMEISHRGSHYMKVHEEARGNIRKLMNLPAEYEVLFVQGGATGQFAMVPMNLLRQGETADYTNSGAWAKKAIEEAQRIGMVHVAANTEKDIPTRVPRVDQLKLSGKGVYLHITTNETISGAQWKHFPKVNIPLVADMSSDILSRQIDVKPFGLIYAGAQKNLGPSGVAVVIMRKDLAERAPENLPRIFHYKTYIENDSMYNTPPCFAIYVLSLVTRWLLEQGGVAAIEEQNEAKAAKLYAAIDRSNFYKGTAVKEQRSNMNVTFRLPSEELEERFAKAAAAEGLDGLKGHRSVGGMRASIYNAFPEEGVDALIAFMERFQKQA